MTVKCPHRSKAIWVRGGVQIAIGVDWCELIKQRCTKELRKHCPFEKECKYESKRTERGARKIR